MCGITFINDCHILNNCEQLSIFLCAVCKQPLDVALLLVYKELRPEE